MQLAAEAALSAPTEADVPSQQQQQPQQQSTLLQVASETTNAPKSKMSIQNLEPGTNLNSATTGNGAFTATKSVRTLARYLDMCLMRQRELRRAVTLHTTSVSCSRNRRYSSSSRRAGRLKTVEEKFPDHSLWDSQRDKPTELPCELVGKPGNSIGGGSSNRRVGPPLAPRANALQPSLNSHSETNSIIRPEGTNCLNLICCCGLFGWCFRQTCAVCCRCQRRRGFCCRQEYRPERPPRLNSRQSSYKSLPSRNSKTSSASLFCCCNRGCGAKQTSIREVDLETGFSRTPTEDITESTPDALYHKVGDNIGDSQCTCCRHQGNFLIRLYFLVKVLYLLNSIGQICLMEYYTGVQYNFYGLRVLYDLARGRQWEESGHFPRVTFCDFEARKLAQSHYYTLQCVLPINMFLEKIYIFLWIWIFLVGLITLCSLLIWVGRLGTVNCRLAWIRQQLITIRQWRRGEQNCPQFVEGHLGPDGVFLLRLIAQNYGNLVAGDTVGELWGAYWQRRTGNSTPIPASGDQTRQRREESMNRPPSHYARRTANRNIAKLYSQENIDSRVPLPLSSEQLSQPTSNYGLKDGKKRNILNTGYSAAYFATEMLPSTDRRALALLATSKKPASVHSRDNSSQSSRQRDRDETSPPPLPQRSSESTACEYSLSEHQSLHSQFGGRYSSNSPPQLALMRQETDVGVRADSPELDQNMEDELRDGNDYHDQVFGVDDQLGDADEMRHFENRLTDELHMEENIV